MLGVARFVIIMLSVVTLIVTYHKLLGKIVLAQGKYVVDGVKTVLPNSF
jgi:hypothetical protein